MTERSLIKPLADELPALVAELVTKVDDLLSSPRWRLLRGSSKLAHHVHAAAGLRHAVALLQDVVDAVERRREAALRVLGRAHLEAWLVAMYVTAYGDEALADIAAGYTKAISSQHTRLAEYDESLQREIAKAKGRNKRIRARNRDLQRWNEAHPEEPPKALTDEVPLPKRTPVGLDLAAVLADVNAGEDEVPPLALAGIVARLNEYGRAEEGPDALFDMVYDLAYRRLSTLGAHPTLWVLNAYVDNWERRAMVGTVPEMRATSMGEPVLSTAVMLTAALAQKVIGLKGDEAPTAAEVSARYEIVDGEKPPPCGTFFPRLMAHLSCLAFSVRGADDIWNTSSRSALYRSLRQFRWRTRSAASPRSTRQSRGRSGFVRPLDPLTEVAHWSEPLDPWRSSSAERAWPMVLGGG